MRIVDCIQGSEEWHHAHLGMVTASCFHEVLAQGEGKVRSLYMRKLAGEIITGAPRENYVNGYMERGKTVEPEARNMYAMMGDHDVQQVGFIVNECSGDPVGCSPDGLIGNDGMVEIKSEASHILIERFERGGKMHEPQIQGSLWVAEREWIDLVSYCPKMKLWTRRFRRDENYIRRLEVAIGAFYEEMHEMIERYRAAP